MSRLRVLALTTLVCLVASGCSMLGGEESQDRIVHARFTRAIQVFPGNSVRVLGVDVGRVLEVENLDDSVDVTFRIDEPDIKLPSDVQATIVPISLLGERYIQLFPAYSGGPEFTGDTIDLAQTHVPVEQDELLRSLQDYFGALDPKKVGTFVSNAAVILEGNGARLNRLIDEGSGAIGVLASKRDSIAELIQEFNTVTVALSTRQAAIARLIKSYNVVSANLNENRAALEGTITGLNQAAAELASLLIENRDPLGQDIKALTRTMRTLSRNAHRFARTFHWAKRLFDTARRAGDPVRHWLRLGNQGAPLEERLEENLKKHLKGLCERVAGEQECSTGAYWEREMPSLFCTTPGECAGRAPNPGSALERAIESLPDEAYDKVTKEIGMRNCRKAKHPKRCKRHRERDRGPAEELDQILEEILEEADDSLPGGLESLGGAP